MHQLFSLVLNIKDLSKAGDLFALSDRFIVNDITEILSKVREVIASAGYAQNDNDQSIVEITISRIAATFRDTNCIEGHIDAVVDLLKTCLNHDLKPLGKDTDPPHAKVALDILASIFLNYTKWDVMKKSIPIAVKFLHKGNRELTRNISSYLPLAAIEFPALIAENIQPIIDSVIGGNYGLAKILPQVYPLNPDRLNEHVMALANILSLCDDSEKLCLLNLLKLIASKNSAVTVSLLEPCLPQLLECLNEPETTTLALGVLLAMATESKLLQDHLDTISNRASGSPMSSTSLTLCAKLFAEIGRHSSHDKSNQCLAKMILLMQLSNQDPSAQIQILKEVVMLTQNKPSMVNAVIINKIQTHLSTSRGFSGVQQILLEKLWDTCSHRNITVVNIRDNDQFSSTNTAASSSTELLLKPPASMSTSTPTSPYILSSMNPQNGNLINRIQIFNSHESRSQPISSHMPPRIHVAPMKSQNMSSGGLRYPYTQPSMSILSQQQTGLPAIPTSGFPVHYKSLSRLPVGGLSGEYKKRTALITPYQNRSICSSIGWQDEFSSSSALKSIGASQNLGVTNSPMVSTSSHYATPQHQFIDTNPNSALYAAYPQQNLSLLKSYFTANSGTLSSSASIHAMASNVGSRSTHTIGGHQHPTPMLGSKGLPSPSSKPILQQDPHPIVNSMHQPYHYSQPELRHNSNNRSNQAATNSNAAEASHRISVFEPFPMRDTILHFCEKHLDKIKSYMEKVCVRIPLPVKCTIEERKSKKSAKLHFSCQCRTNHCLYISNRLFTMKTRHPRVWIHLMFLALQARSNNAMSSRDSSVTSLRNCWDTLKCDSKSFLAIVTSAFPSTRDQDLLTAELRNAGFFDLFEFNAIKSNWGCFFCNYPTRAMEFLSSEEPILEGCLKEKKGKWRLFKRWRTRYFTLSGGQLQAKGTDSSSTLNLHQILSLRVTRGQRSIPKAFEIFTTEEKKIVLKPKDGKNASEWVQCLSVLVAQKAAEQREGHNMEASIYSGHHPLGMKGSSNSMSALRTEV